MSFDISIQQHGDEVAVIAVSGELDLRSAPDLKVPLLDRVFPLQLTLADALAPVLLHAAS